MESGRVSPVRSSDDDANEFIESILEPASNIVHGGRSRDACGDLLLSEGGVSNVEINNQINQPFSSSASSSVSSSDPPPACVTLIDDCLTNHQQLLPADVTLCESFRSLLEAWKNLRFWIAFLRFDETAYTRHLLSEKNLEILDDPRKTLYPLPSAAIATQRWKLHADHLSCLLEDPTTPEEDKPFLLKLRACKLVRIKSLEEGKELVRQFYPDAPEPPLILQKPSTVSKRSR